METLAQSLDQQLIAELARVPQVEAVYLAQAGNKLIVYSVINQSDEDVYDRIYECERHLIRENRGVHFDFNVTARRGAPIETIFGDVDPVWRRGIGSDCHLQTNI